MSKLCLENVQFLNKTEMDLVIDEEYNFNIMMDYFNESHINIKEKIKTFFTVIKNFIKKILEKINDIYVKINENSRKSGNINGGGYFFPRVKNIDDVTTYDFFVSGRFFYNFNKSYEELSHCMSDVFSIIGEYDEKNDDIDVSYRFKEKINKKMDKYEGMNITDLTGEKIDGVIASFNDEANGIETPESSKKINVLNEFKSFSENTDKIEREMNRIVERIDVDKVCNYFVATALNKYKKCLNVYIQALDSYTQFLAWIAKSCYYISEKDGYIHKYKYVNFICK